MMRKSPKPLFADLKSTAFILGLVGLVLVSGFITSKTLRPETSAETPVRANVNASSRESVVYVSSATPDVKLPTGDPPPGSRKSVTPSGNPDVTVWVNTNSGVYHCPNTRWYGTTGNGEYMTQGEAQAKGYRPAYGSVCG
jgi:hypothetical protein